MTNPLSHPRQIAYAVRDLSETTLQSWRSTWGIGPFVTVHDVELASCRSSVDPEWFRHSSAYGQLGDLMIELVVEHQTRRLGPTTGVHHIAHFVPDLEQAIAHCTNIGWNVALDATTVGGQRFVMCDARADLGHLVELYEPNEKLIAFYDHVRLLSDDTTT